MKNLKSILPIFLLLLLIACKKDKESPIACISGPDKVDRKQSVQYSWCGSWVTESEVQWTTSWGQTGTGPWFSPEFPSIGKYTITASGSNKNGSATKSMDVEYGVFATARVVATNECFVGNTAISSAHGYKAFAYSNLADWTSDLKTQSHSKAIDSSDFQYSSEYQTIFAEVTTTVTPGNKIYFALENRSNGQLSNYGDLATNVRNPNTTSQSGQLIMTEWNNNVVYSKVDEGSKRLLSGKWKLTNTEINGNTTTPDLCNQDDYISFSAGGTWEYNIGADNCGGISLPSTGTYAYNFPICTERTFGMTTLSGPFTGNYFVVYYNELKVYFTSGANTGFFRFTYNNP